MFYFLILIFIFVRQPFPNQEKDVETSLERNPKPIKNNYVEEHRQFLSFVSDRRIATNPINSRFVLFFCI